jgi:excisionase family DNA binding protein
MATNDGSGSTGSLRTRAETARQLHISERHLWKITASGELPAIKIGRTVRYAQQDIDAFIASRRTTKAEG